MNKLFLILIYRPKTGPKIQYQGNNFSGTVLRKSITIEEDRDRGYIHIFSHITYLQGWTIKFYKYNVNEYFTKWNIVK